MRLRDLPKWICLVMWLGVRVNFSCGMCSGGVFPHQALWRSPSGAAEDRNRTPPLSRPTPISLAVALRGGRGSQPLRSLRSGREGPVGGRPPGRPRIATCWACANSSAMLGLAVALRGGRGSQRGRPPLHVQGLQIGGRPPGRPRIATSTPSSDPPCRRFGGRPPGRPRIATTTRACPPPGAPGLAVALRGGRGSQPGGHVRPRDVGRHWRSPSGAAEDRNCGVCRQGKYCCLWRSPSGAAEDRNLVAVEIGAGSTHWRSPSGAAEDRNPATGSRTSPNSPWRSPSGAAEDRNQYLGAEAGAVGVGGRPPGRPRIATERRPANHLAAAVWRSPSGAAEDRNLFYTQVCRPQLRLAVALRGGRGSQPARPGPVHEPGPLGGRPPGRPRIATHSWSRV